MLAVSLLWVADASAGLMLSSFETDQLQIVASCSAPVDQPLPEESSERFLQGSSGCPSMTRSASVQGPELINAISIVDWLAADGAAGERFSPDQCPNLPAAIPIELLKIPISITAT